LDRIFERMTAMPAPKPAAAYAASLAAAQSHHTTADDSRDDRDIEDNPESHLTEADRLERSRIIDALNLTGWRRQDTASELGISRKVLWEKMRKLQISTQSENI